MRRSRVRITTSVLIKVMFALMILYMAFFPLGNRVIVNLVRICTILDILAIGALTFYQYQDRFRPGEALAFYVLISIIICSFIVYSIVPTLDNMLSVLSILCLLLLISISDRIKIDKSLITFIYSCSIVMALVEIGYSQTKYAHWNGYREHIHLVLGIENPNLTAIFLFLIYAMLIITMKGQKHRWIAILLEGYLLWMIWQTYSRAVIIAAIVLSLVTFGKKLVRIPKLIILGCCAVPFIFVPIYMDLYQRMSNFQILGKSIFSGRQNDFINYLSMIDTPMKQLFGNLGLNMFQNAHNGPLAIYTAIGLIGTIAFYYILIKRLVKASERASAMGNVAIVAILSCFLHSCGEAALFLGGFPGIVFMFAMFVFTHTPVELSK